MKYVTPQQLDGIIESIVSERQKTEGQKFIGIEPDELLVLLHDRIGDQWLLKKDNPIKLDKEDLNAVANSRFFRKTGRQLLMLLAIIVLGLTMFTLTWQFIPQPIYIGACGVATLVLFWLYSKKQGETRKALWKSFNDNE